MQGMMDELTEREVDFRYPVCTQITPLSLHDNGLAIKVLLRKGGQLLLSIRCCTAGKGGRIVCKAKSLEYEVLFCTCRESFDTMVLCDKRVGFQGLHLLKQYKPGLSPGLSGSWFRDSSDHNFPSVLH